MQKFSELKSLVETHLNGHLEKLKVEYQDDVTMKMEFYYLDDDDYHMFYDVLVHTETHKVDFLEHYCNFGRDYITLKQHKPFEHAVHHYFFDLKK